MVKKLLLFIQLAFSVFFVNGQIQLDSTVVDTFTIKSGLSTVWDISYGNDGWIWYTERTGKISKVNPATGENKLLALLTDVYENASGGQETGLLGMALHPNFSDTPWVFVVYNYLDGSSIKEKLVRFTYTADTLLNPAIVLDNISGGGNHDGSRLIITSDRKIMMTTGDAGNQNNPQDLNALEGKILRMNLDGTVPSDNPLAGKLIWAWGSRNAQGLTVGPGGMIYSSEHGPLSDDEINILFEGRNYGWPVVKGLCDSPGEMQFCLDSNVMEPILAWTPTIAPAGLDYYTETSIPEFENALLLCTLKEQDLRAIRLNSSGDSAVSEKIYLDNIFGRIRDVCIAPNGDVFIGTSNRDGRAQNPFPLAEDDRIIRLRTSPLSGGYLREERKSFIIYPNPSDGKFHISGPEQQFYSVEIFNLLGERVYFSNKYNELNVDLLSQPAGIYTVILKDTAEVNAQKIIIQK